MASFSLEYDDWNPEEERLREALCALGNGYFATRGAGAETKAKINRYPGTYLAGGYNRVESEVAGRIIENEDLVNWPNWTCLNFRVGDGRWFDLENVQLLDYRQELDMERGLLKRRIEFRDSHMRETLLRTERFVSMAGMNLAGIRWTLKPLNWSGKIEVSSFIDGNVSNSGVERYSQLNGQHIQVRRSGKIGERAVYLESQTSQSEIVMVQAARTEVYTERSSPAVERRDFKEEKLIGQKLLFECEENKESSVEKIVCLYTSKDRAISHPKKEAEEEILSLSGYDELAQEHSLYWKQLWNRCDILLSEQDRENKILRLHIYHLLQTVSMNSIDLDTGVPSRGLHGEAYRGHIFWDEIYIFPFLNFRIPEITRSLLMYRYRRLNAARRLAEKAGYQGAMYPWQSGSNGREESQELHLNPNSGKWDPDPTHLQRHINANIVYNICEYYEVTDDREFLSMYGIEMAVEISRFWVSKATYSAQRRRYEIHGVVGPDEFHTGYLGREEQGVDNNAYTNYMASYTIRKTLEMIKLLPDERARELREKLAIEEEELMHWEKVGRSFYIGFDGSGLILQFDGYEELEELDWERYRSKYGDIQRLDRILKAENDTPNRYKLNKQADVLMLFYLFSAEELEDGFRWMGYDFDPKTIPHNIEYYLKRSSNGSTLSRVVNAWVLARVDRPRSWKVFCRALESDVTDIQGGTTAEGIHLGAMAGTVDIIQRCYTGIELKEGILWLNPLLPEELRKLNMKIRYRGHWLKLQVCSSEARILPEGGWVGVGKIGYKDKVYEFERNKELVIPIVPTPKE